MALTVEDGTGGDTMLSVADFETYCESINYDLSGFDDTQEEAALRIASTYVTNVFQFQGERIGMRVQIQAWPRYNVSTDEGWPVENNVVPREVQWAVAEVAFYELNNPGALNPAVTLTDRVTRESVGPIAVEYANMGQDVFAARPTLLKVGEILGPLLSKTSSGSTVVGRIDRG